MSPWGLQRIWKTMVCRTVAEFLSSLCKEHAGVSRISLPYDKALIAGRLGMQPESLSRAFARLKQIGVHVDQNTAMIDDLGRLRGYAESESGFE